MYNLIRQQLTWQPSSIRERKALHIQRLVNNFHWQEPQTQTHSTS